MAIYGGDSFPCSPSPYRRSLTLYIDVEELQSRLLWRRCSGPSDPASPFATFLIPPPPLHKRTYPYFHVGVGVIKMIVEEVRASARELHERLVAKLRGPIQLTSCLQVCLGICLVLRLIASVARDSRRGDGDIFIGVRGATHCVMYVCIAESVYTRFTRMRSASCVRVSVRARATFERVFIPLVYELT